MSGYSTSLDAKRKQIRILILQPLEAGTQIQCSTETVSLLDNPDYEALSYVWGDATIKETIKFDGSSILVTKNLAIAILHLRLPDQPRRLWVDAICINQNDVVERNQQVSMMDEVYRSAKPVLIFLGEASEDSDENITAISTFGKGSHMSNTDCEKIFSFYLALMERGWFTRLWTIQELALATQDPLIGCGSSWTTWSSLLGVWQKVAIKQFTEMGMVLVPEKLAMEENQKSSDVVRPNGIRIDLLNNLRTAVGTNGGGTLRDLLLNTVSAQATEPRDRIYGLLGMMEEEDRRHFTVDYGCPLEMIYAEAVAHLFQKGVGPFMLSGFELAGPTPEDPSFPSWIPRFGSRTLISPIRFHPAGVGVSGAGSGAINGLVDEDLKTLRVRGMYVDTILDKIEFGNETECLGRLQEIEEMVKRANQLATVNAEHRPYLRSFKTKEPAWRTLIAGKKYTGAEREKAPDSYAEMYNILLYRSYDSNHNDMGNFGDEDPARDYRLALLNHLPGECFFITQTGFYGIGQRSIEQGDHLVIWFGAPATFVLKLSGSDEARKPVYSVRGVAYVAGIMDGEIVDEVYCEDLEDDIQFIVR